MRPYLFLNIFIDIYDFKESSFLITNGNHQIMKKITHKILLLLALVSIISCGKTDERLAESPTSRLDAIYDFFNDVRLEIIEIESQYPYLENFTEDTRKFLENKKAQKLFQLAGLYFEKGLDREKGAYEYEDRFFEKGMVLHLIILPPTQETAWKSRIGVDKGQGKQVGQNFIYYQTFTAQPVDDDLEAKINTIIEQNIKKHAAELSEPI